MQHESTLSGSYRVCLSGAALDTGNMGVSALGASLLGLVLTLKPDSDIHLCIGNRSNKPQSLRFNGKIIDVAVVNCRLSPRSALQEHVFWILLLALTYRLCPLPFIRKLILKKNRWLRTIQEADFIGDIRGGDSFSDIYGLNRLFFGLIPSLITLTMGKKLFLLPQTYGPFKSYPARILARFVLKHAGVILSRDSESLKTVHRLLGNQTKCKKVLQCPDVAFSLESVVPEIIETEPSIDFESSRPLVGINVNGLMYNGGYTRNNMFGLKMDYREFISQLLERMLCETDAHLLFVPHTFADHSDVNSDLCATRSALERLNIPEKSRAHLVVRQYDQHELKGIIGKCDFFIGSRMHSCIAALSQAIPTVGVAYSKKFIGVFGSVDVGDLVIDARSMDTEPAVERVLSLCNIRKQLSEKMIKNIPSVRKQIIETFTKLLNPENTNDAGT